MNHDQEPYEPEDRLRAALSTHSYPVHNTIQLSPVVAIAARPRAAWHNVPVWDDHPDPAFSDPQDGPVSESMGVQLARQHPNQS